MLRNFWGRTTDYAIAKKLLLKAKNNGYKDAIIVAFKNDTKISINDYLSSLKN